MKTTILNAFIAITLVSVMVSCKKDTTEVLNQLEKTKLELNTYDSIILSVETDQSAIISDDTTKTGIKDAVQILILIENKKKKEELKQLKIKTDALYDNINSGKITIEDATKELQNIKAEQSIFQLKLNELKIENCNKDTVFKQN